MNSHNVQQLYIFYYKNLYKTNLRDLGWFSLDVFLYLSPPFFFFFFFFETFESYLVFFFPTELGGQTASREKNTQSKKQTQWHFRKLHRISLYPVPLQDRNLSLCLMAVWMLWWDLALIASRCSSAGFCFERKGFKSVWCGRFYPQVDVWTVSRYINSAKVKGAICKTFSLQNYLKSSTECEDSTFDVLVSMSCVKELSTESDLAWLV